MYENRDAFLDAFDHQIDPEDELLFWDGYDEAIIGLAERCGSVPVVAYDYLKLAEKEVRDGMEIEDALEWVETNLIGAWLGHKTPIVVQSMPLADIRQKLR